MMGTRRICLKCGREIVGRRSHAKFCSDLCRIEYYNAIWRRNNPEKSAEQMARAGARYAARKKAEREERLRANPVTCAYCGKMFVASRAGVKYCSKSCCTNGWHRDHPGAYREAVRARNAKNARQIRALRQLWYAGLVEKMETDPAVYALFREKGRKYQAAWRRRRGIVTGKYRPLLSRRIPDYACKNEDILDSRSVMLVNNLSDEQLKENMAFSVELSRDRSRKRDRFGEIR